MELVLHSPARVQGRSDWHALQAQLAAARDLFAAGDHAQAINAIDAALGIAPGFLAAHLLRDQILAAGPSGLESPAPVLTPPLMPPRSEPPPPEPIVSAEGYARFEKRAKQRRMDRRLDAARAALRLGRVDEAAAALDELVELDPELPQLVELGVRLEELRRSRFWPPSGRSLAAVLAFGVVLFGASYVQDAGSLASRSIVSVMSPMAPPAPLAATLIDAAVPGHPRTSQALQEDPAPAPILDLSSIEHAVATRGIALADNRSLSPTVTVAPASVAPRPIQEPSWTPPPMTAAPVTPAPVTPVAVTPAPVTPVAVTTPVAVPALDNDSASPASAVVVDDEMLVRAALQRYRSAYERLDARSAHSVYPGVNEAALARAFQALKSQALTFDACDVQMRGEAAAATCHGSARYIPKIGSHEPRTETRVWRFTFRKTGTDWTIENARADR